MNDGVSVDISQEGTKGNIRREDSEGNSKTTSVTVITKEDPKASQALIQEMKVDEDKKLGVMLERNLQEIEGVISPLPQSN